MLRFQYSMFGGEPPKKQQEEQPDDSKDLSEREMIIAWRYLMLLGLGLSPDDALHLIRNPHLDWHEARRLVDKGCPTELILRLLEA